MGWQGDASARRKADRIGKNSIDCGGIGMTAMRIRWRSSLASLGSAFLGLAPLGGLFSLKSSNAQRRYDLQAVPEFVLEQRPFSPECADRTPGQPLQPGVHLVSSMQAPYLRTRLDSLVLPRTEVPALTIAANPSQEVVVAGNSSEEWALRFCACGEGNSEEEARGRLKGISLSRTGGTVSLNGPGFGSMSGSRGNLIVEAPTDASITIHASFSAAEVRGMAGPVRVTAIHGRARLLNNTGKVDAAGFVVDYAGSSGTVILSAEAEINLRLTAASFQGRLTAWAQGPVRVLVPQAFHTPFQAAVNRPQDFVCRTDFSAKLKREEKNGLYVFTYPGDGSTPPDGVHLRSGHATVVIDTAR